MLHWIEIVFHHDSYQNTGTQEETPYFAERERKKKKQVLRKGSGVKPALGMLTNNIKY